MQKKILLLLGLVAILGVTTSQVMAHSTIYTDDIGRMHFLGKDNGGEGLVRVEDFSNPAEKDVTNATLTGDKVNSDSSINETKVNDTTGATSQKPVLRENKAKGSFTSKKGSMDASNPYVYGGTNLENNKIEDDPAKKHFWRIW